MDLDRTQDAFQEVLAPPQFKERFQQLVREIDPSSVKSTKNRPLEELIRRQTGWRVAVKSISSIGLIKNRIGETGNKPDRPKYAVALVPESLVGAVRGHARSYVAAPGGYDAIGIVSANSDPPQLVHLIYRQNSPLPPSLLEAFPDVHLDALEDAEGTSRLSQSAGSEGTAIEDPTGADASRSALAVGVTRQPTFLLDDCADAIGIGRKELQSWLRRLARKKHLVFQGPPGTGKTHIARQVAKVVVSGSLGRVEFLQFHPSYSYEDFVQGIRPSEGAGGQLRYTVEPGRFLRFCEGASRAPNEPFVLIIDEMNRGNLSQIFGELLFLLEYRNESIPLAQNGTPFAVPQNLRILATMNTADRSIALIDHALRRRFSFVFLEPNYHGLEQMLSRHGFDSQQLPRVLRRINTVIGDRHYHLGTSFFLSASSELKACLAEIWEGEIEPYLEEFFLGQESKIDEFRWSKLIEADLSAWASDTQAKGTP